MLFFSLTIVLYSAHGITFAVLERVKCFFMRSSAKIIFVIAAVSVAAAVVYKLRKERCSNILTEISDQGYETAHDILFPRSRGGSSKLHYGPVLPHN